MPTLKETIDSGCWKECPRQEQFIRLERKKITIEQVNDLYKFMQGEVPECLTMKRPPHLSETMAFRIIYYLQEIMGILPDTYERCVTCGILYDSNNEGSCYKGMHCDYCRKD